MLLVIKLKYKKECQMDCIYKLSQSKEFQLLCWHLKAEDNPNLCNCINTSTSFYRSKRNNWLTLELANLLITAHRKDLELFL